MYDYLIVHGSFGHQYENWTPWLFNKLEEDGKHVLVPQFPTLPQNYWNWKSVLTAYDKYIGENTSVIAHSLGPAFVLNYIIQQRKRFKNLYLIAPFYGLINNPDFDEVNKTFFIMSTVGEATNYTNKVRCFFSDNDPYVPREMSEDIASQLNATTEIVKGGGHINKSAGYDKFDRLLQVIKEDE
jgi:predicted alpha/beta hydrolase family esterase